MTETKQNKEDKIIDIKDFVESTGISDKIQEIIKMHRFIAQNKRSMYLCYIQAGFSKQEALQLIKD